jgi:hypothetical protein
MVRTFASYSPHSPRSSYESDLRYVGPSCPGGEVTKEPLVGPPADEPEDQPPEHPMLLDLVPWADPFDASDAEEIYAAGEDPSILADGVPAAEPDPAGDVVHRGDVAPELASEAGEHVSSSESESSAPCHEAAAPAAVPDPPHPFSLISGPSDLGYFCDRRTGRSIAHLTKIFGTSVSVKCMNLNHGACSLPIAEWKLPPRLEIVQWILEGVELPKSATSAEKKAESAKHLQLLRDRVARSTWPGRTRASLIAEAAADETPAAV